MAKLFDVVTRTDNPTTEITALVGESTKLINTSSFGRCYVVPKDEFAALEGHPNKQSILDALYFVEPNSFIPLQANTYVVVFSNANSVVISRTNKS